MRANATVSRSEYNGRLEDTSFTELENLTKNYGCQSEQYTYYRVEYISPSLYRSQIVVAVWED